MQFYVIHEDPKRNAELLPDYAIKNVNVREGWQILSDIGHAVGVTWEGQNKCYNINHPATRRWHRDQKSFAKFLLYYASCINEYEIRFKKTSFSDKFVVFLMNCAPQLGSKIPESRTEEEFTMQYLLTAKKDKLSFEERSYLMELYVHGL